MPLNTAAGAQWFSLAVLVLRPGAALGWGQPPALGGNRAALHAVGRRHLHGDRAVSVGLLDLVHLRRAHPLPQLADRSRHLRLDPNVTRLVVAGPVPRGEDRGELVERELPVGRRIATGAVGLEELVLGVRLAADRACGKPAL